MTVAVLRVPKAATAIIVEFEGFSSRAYLDRIASPPVWTLGTGFTRGVKAGQTITRAQNAARLIRELTADYLPAVRSACLRKPNDNQLGALLSFVFNVGVGGVSAITKVGHALRGGDWSAAGEHMLEWCKAGGKTIYGLQRRRIAERKLLMTPVKRTSDGRFAGFQKDEREAIAQYDDWRKRGVNLDGRKRLRAEMRTMRKRVWHAAQGEGGWAKGHRRERYRALLSRTR